MFKYERFYYILYNYIDFLKISIHIIQDNKLINNPHIEKRYIKNCLYILDNYDIDNEILINYLKCLFKYNSNLNIGEWSFNEGIDAVHSCGGRHCRQVAKVRCQFHAAGSC